MQPTDCQYCKGRAKRTMADVVDRCSGSRLRGFHVSPSSFTSQPLPEQTAQRFAHQGPVRRPSRWPDRIALRLLGHYRRRGPGGHVRTSTMAAAGRPTGGWQVQQHHPDGSSASRHHRPPARVSRPQHPHQSPGRGRTAGSDHDGGRWTASHGSGRGEVARVARTCSGGSMPVMLC
jgi:hypothetical protein